MTLDQVAWVYLSAFAEEGRHDVRAVIRPDARTVAGVRAVVMALKWEIVSTIKDGESWPWTSVDADDWFDEILGEAVEKAGGGPHGNAGALVEQRAASTAASATTPAADPPPAVCVWTKGTPPQDFELRLLRLLDETYVTAWWSEVAKQWEPEGNYCTYSYCEQRHHDLSPIKHDKVWAWLDLPPAQGGTET